MCLDCCMERPLHWGIPGTHRPCSSSNPWHTHRKRPQWNQWCNCTCRRHRTSPCRGTQESCSCSSGKQFRIWSRENPSRTRRSRWRCTCHVGCKRYPHVLGMQLHMCHRQSLLRSCTCQLSGHMNRDRHNFWGSTGDSRGSLCEQVRH